MQFRKSRRPAGLFSSRAAGRPASAVQQKAPAPAYPSAFPVDEDRAALLAEIAAGADSVDALLERAGKEDWARLKKALRAAYVDGLVRIEDGRVSLTSLGARAAGAS